MACENSAVFSGPHPKSEGNFKNFSHGQRKFSNVSLLVIAAVTTVAILAAELRPAAAQTIKAAPTTAPPQPPPPLVALDAESVYYYIGCYTARTDLLKESVYAKTPQTCIDICEHQTYNYAILSGDRCFCSNDLIANERQAEQLCNTRCLANKSQYCGGAGVHSYYSTMLANGPAPQHLRIVNATENTLTIAWQTYIAPKMLGDALRPRKVTSYRIKSQVAHTYSTLPFFAQPEFIVQATVARFEITDLHPATTYNVSVDAMCDDAVCGSSFIEGQTVVARPSPSPSQPRVLGSTDSTITVELPPIHNDNGPVSKLLVIVERVDASISQPFDVELLGPWEKAQDDGVPYYIAAEFDFLSAADNRTREFTVGDGKRYGRYRNPPLEKNDDDDIHISLGVVSSLNGVTKTLYTRGSHDQHSMTLENFTYATFDSGSQSIAALIIVCVIFGTCFVLSVLTYFYLRYKACKVRSGGLRNAHELTLQQPIIERENNGFVVEDELPVTTENFKQQLNSMVSVLDGGKRLQRNALRMNVNDIVAEGAYGEVVSGKLITNSAIESTADCQLHVISLDELSNKDQAHLLQEFRHLSRLQSHPHILDFYGVSASVDWFYIVFERQTVSLKKRLVDSRRAPSSVPTQRITSLSEELLLQWIYELASALEYLSQNKVVLKNLCSHSIFVSADAQLKVSAFGPVPYAAPNTPSHVDLTRWLAPETLRYQHYTSKSDIWSFGVVAWECCAVGGTPYANISNSQQILDAIKGGARPAQPSYIYQDLYQLLLNCWQLEPSDRISFEDIAFNIRQLMTSPRHALCFDGTTAANGGGAAPDVLPFYLPLLEIRN